MGLSANMPSHVRLLAIETALAEAMEATGFEICRGSESGGYWEVMLPGPSGEAERISLFDLAREMEIRL